MSEEAMGSGFVDGAYAERRERPSARLDDLARRALGPATRRRAAGLDLHARIAARVTALASRLETQSDDALRTALEAQAWPMDPAALFSDDAAHGLALLGEIAFRRLGLRPHHVQVLGAHVLLAGRVAEMQTGEGKSLTAAIAGAYAARAGLPVHVVSVNDYLVARDADEMTPFFEAAGLHCGVIQNGMSPDERRATYRSDVTYVTNSELAFDYLKDRLALGRRTSRTGLQLERLLEDEPRTERLLLRGLHFGIIDEADSVLIDEARTPLVISAGENADGLDDDVFQAAIEVARGLESGGDFVTLSRERIVTLTESGRRSIMENEAIDDRLPQGPRLRVGLVAQALAALHLYERDRDYLIDDGQVEIIDASTGRRMPDRSWEQGLHQMIQAKEDCDVTSETVPLAKISYQRFFGRFRHLAGMTGTAQEVAGELWSVYRLAVVRVPTNRPVLREDLGERVLPTAEARWDAICDRVEALRERGCPVLIGTRSLSASEALSERLHDRGIEHRVLNARQDAEEAEIVRCAGEAGRITVATNMAGRGTDIKLDAAACEAGGLHVIASERNEARRIDRQLFGRAGRQGDPGSFERIVSLEDEIARDHLGRLADVARGLSALVQRRMLDFAQRRAERRNARIRTAVMRSDEAERTKLAFAGEGE